METEFLVKCRICGTPQQVPMHYSGKMIKCVKCQNQIAAIAYKPSDNAPIRAPSKVTKEEPLPGTRIAALWSQLGYLGIWVTVISLPLVVYWGDKAGLTDEDITYWVLVCAVSGFYGVIVSYTIAAIIRAINANTLELRKLREDQNYRTSQKMSKKNK